MGTATHPVVAVTLPESGAVIRTRLLRVRGLIAQGTLTEADRPAIELYERVAQGAQPTGAEVKLLWDFTLKVCRAGLDGPDDLVTFMTAGLTFADYGELRDAVLFGVAA